MALTESESRERLFEVVLIVDPENCEVIDGRIVIRKAVIARGRTEAISRFGVEVR